MFERALDVNYNAPNIWLKYAEMEMRHRFVNHARNVWDRAVTLMPRVDQLWCVPKRLFLCTRCPIASVSQRTAWLCIMITWQRYRAMSQVTGPQVQVHPHGGDAGQCGWRAPDLRALDEVGAGPQWLVRLHQGE